VELELAPVTVKKSSIHGSGVVARAKIAAGTPTLEYLGKRLSPAAARRQTDNPYLLNVDARTTIDGSAENNVARFLNHSCAPNLELLVYKKRVFLIALRDIKRGEELTYDYNLVIHGDVDVQTALADTACACGAPDCRGTMLRVDDDPAAKKALQKAMRKKK
jgi:SET domain-containing protein